MSPGRAVQFLGLLIVTWVMVTSWVEEPSMLYQFGGLGLGAAIFLLGRALPGRGSGRGAGG